MRRGWPTCHKMRLVNHFDLRRPIRDPKVLERMAITFDLYEMAEQMKRQQLRRRNPNATEAEIEEGVLRWLAERPGAEHGDGEGRPGRLFEE